MSFNFILLFSMTVFVASIIPGPSMLLALTHGMNFGIKKTFFSALGNATVTLIQASISIAGLGTILITSKSAFQIIKWAGAAYLVYMGISLFLASKTSASIKLNQGTKFKSLKKMYLQGAFVTAGNPKAIIFFTAVFPQFVNPNANYLFQSIILLSICIFIAFSCFMIYAIGGKKIVSLISKTSISKYIQRIIGGTFIGAGIGLIFSNK